MTKNPLIFGGVTLLVGMFAGIGLAGLTDITDRHETRFNQEKNHRGHDMEKMTSAMDDSRSTPAMVDTMSNMMHSLDGKTGDDFDDAFLTEMIVHHEGAVAMAEAALVSSQRPEITTMANAIIDTQMKEITQMKAWQASWFGATN